MGDFPPVFYFKMDWLKRNEAKVLKGIDGEQSYKSLITSMGMNKTSLCFAMDSLAKKGLLIKKALPKPGEPILIRLTPEGLRIKELVKQIQ